MPDQFRHGIGRALNGKKSGTDAANRGIGGKCSYGEFDEPLEEFNQGLRTEKAPKAGCWRYPRKIRCDAVRKEPWGVLGECNCYSGDEDSSYKYPEKIGDNSSSELEELDGILTAVQVPAAGILNVDSQALRQIREKARSSGGQKCGNDEEHGG